MSEVAEPTTTAAPVPLLRTEKLTRHFTIGNLLSRSNLHAVDNADLAVNEREIVALAGESGSQEHHRAAAGHGLPTDLR